MTQEQLENWEYSNKQFLGNEVPGPAWGRRNLCIVADWLEKWDGAALLAEGERLGNR